MEDLKMKTILTMMEVKDEDYDFYVDELQQELDNPTEGGCTLTAYQTYEENDVIPDIMKRDKIKITAEEALRYGDVKFDITSDEQGGCRRIRVVRLNRATVVIHQFNGEVVECYEV